jgi:RNA polymerase sigma factor (sigma-70 family)
MAEMTDEEATEQMCQCWREDLEALQQRYKGKLKKYLLQQHYDGLNEALAEEICQNVFSRFYTTMWQFKGECSLFTWLCHLASQEVKRHLGQTVDEQPLSPDDKLSDIDKKTIKHIRQCGQMGFNVLHRRYEGRLKGLLMSPKSYGLDESAANVICNNTFFQFYQTITQFKGECSVFTWLYRLARNEASRYFDNENKQNEIKKGLEEKLALGVPLSKEADNEQLENQPEPLSKAEIVLPVAEEKRFCHERCIRQLLAQNPKCAKALILRYDGLSIKEIANEIHKTENATRVFLHNTCRKKLNSCRKKCYSIFKWLSDLVNR